MLILENDTNAEVRRAVLSCIAMSPRTLPKVLKRTRDIKENVRKLAYQVVTNALIWYIFMHTHICQHQQKNITIKVLCAFVKCCELFSIIVFRFWLTKFTLKL